MSKLNEMLSRPATITFTARCDAKYLATLALFWSDNGEDCRSMSELVRLSLEELASVLVSSGGAEWIDNQERALEVLQRCGLGGFKVQPQNLQRSILAEQGLNLSTIHTKRDTSAKIKSRGGGVAAPTEAAALANLEKALNSDQQKDLAERLAKAKSTTVEALSGLGQLPTEKEEKESNED